jgi:HK97 family phage major capsid protein
MDNIISLKQERARAVGELRSIVEAAEGENRELTSEEREKYDRVNDAISSFNRRIDDVENVREQASREDRFQNLMDGSALGHTDETREIGEKVRAYTAAFDTYLRGGVAELDLEQRKDAARGRPLGGAARRNGGRHPSLGGYTVPQDFADKLFALKIQAGAIRQTGVTVFRTGDGRDMPVPFASAHAAASWGTEATAPASRMRRSRR